MAIAAVLATIVVIAIQGGERLAPESEAYRAEQAYDAGNKDAALQHAERAASMHPQTFYANYLVGAIYLENHRGAEAVPFLARALQIEPSNRAVKAALAQAEKNK